MVRKVVFLGNCQARRFMELYAQNIAPALGDDVSFVASFGRLTDEISKIVGNADVVAAQVYDVEANVGLHNIDTSAKIVLFPNVTGMFLWPFGGQPHPLNKSEESLPHGPYDANQGDRWLDRRSHGRNLDDAEVDRIADEYLALDLAKEAKAERLFELLIDRQIQRDEKSGFACADIIEQHMHDQVLFYTAASYTMPLFEHLSTGLYLRLGAPTQLVERSLYRLVRAPFAPIERPIHPSVAKVFDLRYFLEEGRYQFHTGEYLTLREYVKRYLRYEWNKELLNCCTRVERCSRDISRPFYRREYSNNK